MKAFNSMRCNMQDKFIEEIKGLKDSELIGLYNKICDHINYLSSSIIEVVEEDNVDDSQSEDEYENDDEMTDIDEDGGDNGDE